MQNESKRKDRQEVVEGKFKKKLATQKHIIDVLTQKKNDQQTEIDQLKILS